MNGYLPHRNDLLVIPTVPVYLITVFVGDDDLEFFTYDNVREGDIFFYGNKMIRISSSVNDETVEDASSYILGEIRLYSIEKSKKAGRDKSKDMPIYMQIWPRAFYGEYL